MSLFFLPYILCQFCSLQHAPFLLPRPTAYFPLVPQTACYILRWCKVATALSCPQRMLQIQPHCRLLGLPLGHLFTKWFNRVHLSCCTCLGTVPQPLFLFKSWAFVLKTLLKPSAESRLLFYSIGLRSIPLFPQALFLLGFPRLSRMNIIFVHPIPSLTVADFPPTMSNDGLCH